MRFLSMFPFQYRLGLFISRGGMFSVALSPDGSGLPLAATLSYGVRTFLPPTTTWGGVGDDRLIRSSPNGFLTFLIFDSFMMPYRLVLRV